jgi:hypothetical protein
MGLHGSILDEGRTGPSLDMTVVGHETGTGLATVWSGPRSRVGPGRIEPNGPFQNSRCTVKIITIFNFPLKFLTYFISSSKSNITFFISVLCMGHVINL